MKIRVREKRYDNTEVYTWGEISIQELAEQMTEEDAHELYDCIVDVIGRYEMGNPPKPQTCTCKEPMRYISSTGLYTNTISPGVTTADVRTLHFPPATVADR